MYLDHLKVGGQELSQLVASKSLDSLIAAAGYLH
jgi:hypothetical protein